MRQKTSLAGRPRPEGAVKQDEITPGVAGEATISSRAGGRRPAVAAEHAVILLGFAVLAVVFTYPLVTDLSGSVILARGGDAWLHLWDLWWVKQALTVLNATPFYTTYLYYPTGVSLYFHSLDIVNALLSVPLQATVGLVAGFNLLLLLSVTLSGYAAYLLIFYLTNNRLASGVGACVFALSPIQSTSIELGQLDQVTMQWLPLYLLFLIRSSRERSFVNAPIAALFLSLASLATWYFSLTLVIVTVCFVAYELASDRSGANARKIVVRVGAIAATFAVVMSPLLLPMLGERLQSGQYMVPAFGTTVYNSADLVEFFLPARGGALSTETHHGVNLALGYTPLVLAICGALLARRQSRFWLVTFFVLAILALGPLLRVAGNQTGIPLPYYLLYNLPVAAVSRQPLRFDAVVMLSLGVMAALGVASLQSIAARAAPRLRLISLWGVPAIAGALILFEFLPLPRPMNPLQISPFYRTLAADKEKFAIMELPSSSLAMAMYEQTVAGKPIVGGYTSRHFPYPFAEDTPGVRQLFLADDSGLGADIFAPATSQVAQDVLSYYGIRYVVFHRDKETTGKEASIRRSLQVIFNGVKPEYRDDSISVYRVRSTGQARVAIAPAGGWYDVEGGAAGQQWRWTNGNAQLNLISTSSGPKNLQLSLTAHSFHGTRTLDVFLDGENVGSASVGEASTSFSFPINLKSGPNTLQLTTREPAESPAQLGLGADARMLAVGFSAVEIGPSP